MSPEQRFWREVFSLKHPGEIIAAAALVGGLLLVLRLVG